MNQENGRRLSTASVTLTPPSSSTRVPTRSPLCRRMGHTDAAVTLRAYGHLFAGVQEDLTRRLDDLRRAGGRAPATGEVIRLKRSPTGAASASEAPTEKVDGDSR